MLNNLQTTFKLANVPLKKRSSMLTGPYVIGTMTTTTSLEPNDP